LPFSGNQETDPVSNLPLYLAYVGTAIGLLVVFTFIYTKITPYHEFTLIQEGNKAAAISLAGTMIGFGVVLAATATHSVSLPDMAMWAAVALAFQVLAFAATALLLKDFRVGIVEGKESYGITLAGMSITIALINAGAISF